MSSAASPSASPLTPTQLIDKILMRKADKPEFDLGRLITQIDALLALYATQPRDKSPIGEKLSELPSASETLTFEDHVSRIVELISNDIKEHSGNKNQTIIRVLNASQNGHWIAVPFLVVGAALKVISTIDNNKECFILLESMNNLSKVILQFQNTPIGKMDLHAELNESVQLIVKGAILSCSQESKGYMRGDKDFMDRQELQQLTKNIDDMCNTLHVEAFAFTSLDIVGPGPVSAFNQDSSKTSPEMRRKMKLRDSSTSTFRQDQRESGIVPQPSPASSTICRVRQDLRAIQPEKYNPKRVALGICNHAVSPYLSEMDKEKVNVGKEKVNMGKEKVKALCTTIKRLKDVTVKSLVAEIQGFDLEIRKWYEYNRDGLPEEILA